MKNVVMCAGIASAEEFLKLNRHPIVGASAHKIKLDQPINTDGEEYIGQIFVGENYDRVKVLFDTMSKWTSIIDNEASGVRVRSSYQLRSSSTKQNVLD